MIPSTDQTKLAGLKALKQRIQANERDAKELGAEKVRLDLECALDEIEKDIAAEASR